MMFLLEGTGTTGNTAGGGWTMLIMLGVMFVFLYFFMIRPQKKQEKEKQDMQNGLAVGDEVTTIGGIIGQIVSIKGETFVLETTKDKTKIRFLKGAVRSVDVKASDKAASVLEYQEVPAEELPVAEPVEAPVEEAPAEETQD
jgi:preprotein translocase subunit YajC